MSKMSKGNKKTPLSFYESICYWECVCNDCGQEWQGDATLDGLMERSDCPHCGSLNVDATEK